MVGVVRSCEADRLAKHRREAELAFAEGITILEARARISAIKWSAATARFEQRALSRDLRDPSDKPWMMAE